MTTPREKSVGEAAEKYQKDNHTYDTEDFIAGARWADANPIPCAKCEKLQEKLDDLEDKHRLQMGAISIAALANTPESSIQQRIEKENPYWTLAYQDVCDAVCREMELRSKLEMRKDRCPCGGIILADTEDWPIPTCHECYPKELDELRAKLEIAKAALETIAHSLSYEGDCRCCEFGPSQAKEHLEYCEFLLATKALKEIEGER